MNIPFRKVRARYFHNDHEYAKCVLTSTYEKSSEPFVDKSTQTEEIAKLAWHAETSFSSCGSKHSAISIPLIVIPNAPQTLIEKQTSTSDDGVSDYAENLEKWEDDSETKILSTSSSAKFIDFLLEGFRSENESSDGEASFYFQTLSDHGSLQYSSSFSDESEAEDDPSEDSEDYFTTGFIEVGELPRVY